MKRIFLLVLFTLSLHTAIGQRHHAHTVYFDNMDGFSGYVKFKTVYKSTPTQVTANSGEMVITDYEATDEEITALNKAGLQLKRFRPAKFSFDVTGRAYILIPGEHDALANSNFRGITGTLGDYSNPDFDERAKKQSIIH